MKDLQMYYKFSLVGKKRYEYMDDWQKFDESSLSTTVIIIS